MFHENKNVKTKKGKWIKKWQQPKRNGEIENGNVKANKPGGKCKSLKSTIRLLDVGSDVGSVVRLDHFGHLGI